MKTGIFEHLVNYCHRLAGTGTPGGGTDGHLLERFTVSRDEAAFEEILRRHGPLVMGVCRRMFRDMNDVEDAFQATFLVLVRKARSLDGQASLAGWLHAVAYHIALRGKAAAARRHDVEKRGGNMAVCDPAAGGVWRDLRRVLDEELNRLPEKYRTPLVLCYLEGKTNEEAAQILGWTKGTVSGRLARARDLLRGRLGRRGVTLGAAALGPVLAEQAVAALPPELGKATLLVAAGKAAASATVAGLVEGTVRRSFLSRVKAVAALLMVLGTIGACAFIAASHDLAGPPPQPQPIGRAEKEQQRGRLAVVVQASYPGANAAVVGDNVAVPIEHQVNGTPKMRHMTSWCGNNGQYTLTVTFEDGVDPATALAEVQKRVNLAQPTLPELVKQLGVTIARQPGEVVLFVVLSSDGKFDTLFLSNYATIQLRDELLRVAGVAEINLLGQRDDSMRLWLDPQKLTDRGLTAAEVIDAIRQQNAQVAAGQIGQPPMPSGQLFKYAIVTKGRLADAQQFEEVVVKVTEGRAVKIRDLGRVEQGVRVEVGNTRLDGKEVVALAVAAAADARPAEVSAALRDRLAALRTRLPEGIRLDVAFDLVSGKGTATEALRLDVTLPAASSAERTMKVLERCETLLRDTKGVKQILTLTAPPITRTTNQGCLLVLLAPADVAEVGREKLNAAIRTKVTKEIPDALVRLCDPSRSGRFPLDGYEVRLALQGPDVGEQALQGQADQIVAELSQSGKLTDATADASGRLVPLLSLTIDRVNAKTVGVDVGEVLDTLQVYLGSLYVNDLNRFGRNWQVIVEGHKSKRIDGEEIRNLRVRNAKGDLVPLAALVTVREWTGPSFLHRFNGEPMIEITANLRPGVSAADARAICEKLGADLPAGYRLTWLSELPALK